MHTILILVSWVYMDMNSINQRIIFIVGLGAPASLYDDYLEDLKKKMPQAEILVLEWWSQKDFGFHTLQFYMNHSNVILVAHSGGSVIALQALEKWPDQIKKIVMLDSHFLRTQKTLPTVTRMLDVMLKDDDIQIQNKVRQAYAPVVDDDIAFNQAFHWAVQWVNEKFELTCHLLNAMPMHSVLFIGFTNASYQILNPEEQNALSTLWKKFHVDIYFVLISHFYLIEKMSANAINQIIVDWLSE